MLHVHRIPNLTSYSTVCKNAVLMRPPKKYTYHPLLAFVTCIMHRWSISVTRWCEYRWKRWRCRCGAQPAVRRRWLPACWSHQPREVAPWNIAKEENSLKHCKGRGVLQTLLRKRSPWKHCKGRGVLETLQRKRSPWNTAMEEDFLKHCRGRGVLENITKVRSPWNIAKDEDSLKHCKGRQLPKTLQRKMTP